MAEAKKKAAAKVKPVKKKAAKASAKKAAAKKGVSGYGSGSVDVVMSVDQVAKEAASIAANAPTVGNWMRWPTVVRFCRSTICGPATARWKSCMISACGSARASRSA